MGMTGVPPSNSAAISQANQRSEIQSAGTERSADGLRASNETGHTSVNRTVFGTVTGSVFNKLHNIATSLGLLQKAPPPELQSVKTKLAADSIIAANPYSGNLSTHEKHGNSEIQAELAKWSCSETAEDLAGTLVFSEKNFETDGNKITDSKSGLVATIVINDEDKEARIVFGGTTSGKENGELASRGISNFKNSIKHWIANVVNAVTHHTPKSYSQAATLTTNFKTLIAETKPDFTISVSGHSKGGGEAAYAAALNSTPENPIKAIAFSSAELGSRSLEKILDRFDGDVDAAKQAFSNITHYKVKGDPVPNMHNLLGSVSQIGTTTTIPAFDGVSGPVNKHDHFHHHFQKFASEA